MKENIYIEILRMRLGLDENDTSRDAYINSLPPMRRVRMIAGWELGSEAWATQFEEYFESQGLYLTTIKPETIED